MSKNNNSNKEKSSFWKKLGIGKNKTPSTLSLKSEHDDRISIKSKRLSGGAFLTHQLASQQQEQNITPPLPIKTIKKQPRVNLPKVNLDDDSDILSNFQHQQHVYNNNNNDNDNQSFNKPTITSTTSKKLQLVDNFVSTPTAIEASFLIKEEGTERPKNKVTATSPAAAVVVMNSDNNSNSSFVVIKSTTTTTATTLSPSSSSNDNKVAKEEQDETIKNQELLSIIANLKIQLENEKATVHVLQKQKEAVAKDLDYLELTVDELFGEKTDLLQQLEDEKIKSQRYLEDLNLSLEKQRSNADNARDQSIVVGQTRLEFEAYQEQCRQEQEELQSVIAQRDKSIRELKSKLNKSQEQVETLKITMDQLVKSHTEEMSQITAAHQAALLQQAEENNKEKSGWPLHTPNGSPRIQHTNTQAEQAEQEEEEDDEEEEEEELEQWQSSPIPTSSSTPFHQQQHLGRIKKESLDYNDKDDLDEQLKRLLQEKEQLQSSYSKIPIMGGGPQSRKRREDIESKLDQVDSQLSKIRQKIRRA